MHPGRVIALTRQNHEDERSRSEYQLDDHVGDQDRLRAQRRCAESLEDAALAIDRDDRDQRKHGADGDEKRRENRELHADEATGGERGRRESPVSRSADQQEKQNRDPDRAECSKRLAQEYLDFDPGQFPESTEHHGWAYSRIE